MELHLKDKQKQKDMLNTIYWPDKIFSPAFFQQNNSTNISVDDIIDNLRISYFVNNNTRNDAYRVLYEMVI